MKFERGYDLSREKTEKSPKLIMSCTNCGYFYQASGDKEEVCQNESVLEYDMVFDENRVYCLQWKPSR